MENDEKRSENEEKKGKVRVSLKGIDENFEILDAKVRGNGVNGKNHEKVSGLMGCFSWKCDRLIGI